MSVQRWFAIAAAVLCLAAGPAAADERILEYGSHVRIEADGHLLVTETITVRAEGTNIRRGIYRDFPTRYDDHIGNRFVVDFQLIDVRRDGAPEPYFTEQLANGVRINTGSDAFLRVPAEITYTIRYRTNRQLGFFADHDELYWNVTGSGWDFPIDRAWARIELPKAVGEDALGVDCWTGAFGATLKRCTAAVAGPGSGEYATSTGLAPHDGLTVLLTFPRGTFVPPSRLQKAGWLLRDNGGVLIALIGLVALLAYYGWRWHLVGRDPPAGPLFPQYEPPAGLSAGEVRVLAKMGYDNRAFAADVVQMAVRGALDIHVDGSVWRLARRPDANVVLSTGQRALATKLFAGDDDEVVLTDDEAVRVGGARSAHARAIGQRMSPAYYVSNGGSLFAGIAFSAVVAVAAFAIADGHGLALVFVAVGLMLLAHGLFAAWLKAPTREGRRQMDAIAGLRLYLRVAETDALAATPVPGAARRGGEPPLDAARYEALLPYALALDVDSEWSRRFSDAVGVQEATRRQPDWYHGGSGLPLGLASLGPSLGSALTDQIASSSTPPGSSSGSDGGGFSGGGGGGGGGGGR